MERGAIERKVISIVHEQKTIAEDALLPDTPLEQVGIDSLDALNILFEIEETFGITIPDEEARQLRTVGQIVNAVRQHLAAVPES
ncbi:MAG TPA: acyl carrier protein [Thermoanaerobaculia bacterium]|nr:acyl carrier protein [Thermoanaerobaculia bacterium]